MADIEAHLPTRKGNRLKNFDYSFCGAYFVTICVSERRNIFRNKVGATYGRPYDIAGDKSTEMAYFKTDRFPRMAKIVL